MGVLIGVWIAVAGAVAGLAGLSGMRRARRLRRGGVTTWGVAVQPPASADQGAGESPRQTLIRYTLADRREIERIYPVSPRQAAFLLPGQKVLVWYDPEDPDDILVYGREGRLTDRVFVIAGAAFVLIGVGLAAFSH
jgi:hypothetical protein